MKITTRKQIGENFIDISVDNVSISKALHELGKLSFNGIKVCEMCGSEKLTIAGHEAQSFEYTYVKCMVCGANVNFGEKKSGGVVYLKTVPKDAPRQNKDGKNIYYDWQSYKKED